MRVNIPNTLNLEKCELKIINFKWKSEKKDISKSKREGFDLKTFEKRIKTTSPKKAKYWFFKA